MRRVDAVAHEFAGDVALCVEEARAEVEVGEGVCGGVGFEEGVGLADALAQRVLRGAAGEDGEEEEIPAPQGTWFTQLDSEFRCNKCFKTFNKLSLLKKHIKIHSGEI